MAEEPFGKAPVTAASPIKRAAVAATLAMAGLEELDEILLGLEVPWSAMDGTASESTGSRKVAPGPTDCPSWLDLWSFVCVCVGQRFGFTQPSRVAGQAAAPFSQDLPNASPYSTVATSVAIVANATQTGRRAVSPRLRICTPSRWTSSARRTRNTCGRRGMGGNAALRDLRRTGIT